MSALALILAASAFIVQAAETPKSWAADNGNGTYSNPLFYHGFSDPDMIRVGGDYYLTGAPMHAMPGLPILQTTSGQYLSAEEGGVRATSAKPGDAETFQWVDLQRGDTLLMSLATHRYIVAPKIPGPVAADHPGPAPDRKDGSCLDGRS
jgi:hypothetical protein